MSTFVSAREFAKHIGRSNVWVSRLVKEGKIPVNEKGRIPLQEGMKAYEASQRVGYDANREHAEKQRSSSNKPAAKPRAVMPELPEDDDEPVLAGGNLTQAKLNEAFNRARTAEKTFQAKLREIELKERQGQLLLLTDVQADAAAIGAEIREKLGTVAPRVATICEGKTAREIEGIIEQEINVALQALQKSRFGRS